MSKGRRDPKAASAPLPSAVKADSAPPSVTVVTVQDFQSAVPALGRLFSEARPLDIRLTYRLAKMRQALAAADSPDAAHNVVRMQLIEKFGKRQEGDLVSFETPEAIKGFNEGIAPILSEVLQINVPRLTLDQLDQLQLKEPLTVPELQSIWWLLDEDEAS